MNGKEGEELVPKHDEDNDDGEEDNEETLPIGLGLEEREEVPLGKLTESEEATFVAWSKGEDRGMREGGKERGTESAVEEMGRARDT